MANKKERTSKQSRLRSLWPEPAKAVKYNFISFFCFVFFLFRSHAKSQSNEIDEGICLLVHYDMTHILRKSLSLSSNSRALFIGIDFSSTFGKYGE